MSADVHHHQEDFVVLDLAVGHMKGQLVEVILLIAITGEIPAHPLYTEGLEVDLMIEKEDRPLLLQKRMVLHQEKVFHPEESVQDRTLLLLMGRIAVENAHTHFVIQRHFEF